ncbi:DUF6492 family protein [Aureimonas jatrophae]|uniref:Uncharacterized protein n=1 Tax=Aureimonas jatrophae TaxID=1166073 RepID=A0A1H0L494_9HYPH|nr:DUF6492 family protein [Aureimonas jatrophae]MBB3952398.1 hypothetical protein [Aureimonas jatrophae]SDO62882.1 hypothetical protein SAMN05192530_10930 [Aureimonas jatrophae]
MRVALVTSSYRGDFERCRLLCDSIDRFVTGHAVHLILVARRDVALFRALEGPGRRIVCEDEILPAWLRPVPTVLGRPRRSLWLTPFGPPLRGWHVQQLRRIAMAAALDEDVLVSLDSDVLFVRPFAVGALIRGERVAFYRRPDAMRSVVTDALRIEHEAWSRRAGALLGIAAPAQTETGYIATLIAWRADTVRDMLARIAKATSRAPLRALVGSAALSECTIYGRFVDECENRPDRHEPTDRMLCAVYWIGPPLDERGVRAFLDGLEPDQVAIGLQSFTGTSPDLIRSVIGL